MTIELTEDELQTLTFLLGVATGCLSHLGKESIGIGLRIANSINRNNPNWTPYEVEEKTTTLP